MGEKEKWGERIVKDTICSNILSLISFKGVRGAKGLRGWGCGTGRGTIIDKRLLKLINRNILISIYIFVFFFFWGGATV